MDKFGGTQTSERITDHMSALLSSEHFSTSPRLADLLSFCVKAALSGESDSLKETTIGVGVFGRRPGYDPKIDPIVRVNVRRLRQKLDLFYEDPENGQPIRIKFPKGTYIPAFDIHESENPAASAMGGAELVSSDLRTAKPETTADIDLREPSGSRSTILLTGAIIVAMLSLVFFLQRNKIHDTVKSAANASAPTLLRPLTNLSGRKSDPQLSPDNQTLAFLFDPHLSGRPRIYLQPVNSTVPVALTKTTAPEVRFVWSKDGRSIAFFRMKAPSTYDLVVIDLETRVERVIRSFEFTYTIERPPLDWSPDGHWFVIGEQNGPKSIHLVMVGAADGATKQVTDPPDGSTGDLEARFSPDGKSLAFRRGQLGELYMTSVANQELHDAVRLTYTNPGVRGITWSPNGRSIYFGSTDGGKEPAIWRYDCVTKELKMITLDGLPAVSPSLTRDGKELVFTMSIPRMMLQMYNGDRRRFDQPFDSVGGLQISPSVSPDGDSIVYTSDLTGTMELFSIDRVHRTPRKLSNFKGAGIPMFPSWSSDGKRFVFFYREQGRNYIYEMQAQGTSSPRLLRGGEDYCLYPQYSSDGKSLYFLSNVGGRFRVWRAPLETPNAVAQEVTMSDTRYFRIAEDGRGLYYSSRNDQTTVLIYHNLENNTEVRVWEWRYSPVGFTGWDIKGQLLYYVGVDPTSLVTHMFLANLQTKQTHDLGKVTVGEWFGASSLSVGHDGTTAWISNVATDDGNVMSLRLPDGADVSY
jgi:Tol biopolymer transport system component